MILPWKVYFWVCNRFVQSLIPWILIHSIHIWNAKLSLCQSLVPVFSSQVNFSILFLVLFLINHLESHFQLLLATKSIAFVSRFLRFALLRVFCHYFFGSFKFQSFLLRFSMSFQLWNKMILENQNLLLCLWLVLLRCRNVVCSTGCFMLYRYRLGLRELIFFLINWNPLIANI